MHTSWFLVSKLFDLKYNSLFDFYTLAKVKCLKTTFLYPSIFTVAHTHVAYNDYLGTPLLPPVPRAMKLFFFIFGDLLHTNVSSLFSYVIQASNKWFDFIEQWSWSSLVLRRSRLGQTWTTSPRETRRERLANIANTEILNTEIFKRLCIAIDHDIIPFTLLHKR